MKVFTTIIVICMMLIASIAWSTTLHVPGDYPTIQAGIDAALDGDTVLVADGVYRGEGNRNLDFNGKAITLTSENGARNCIIDFELYPGAMGFFFHSGETETSVLRGFKIINSEWVGIYCTNNSSPTIEENIIAGNRSTESGGGIFCSEGNPIIQNNEIIWNWAEKHGGGICSGSLAMIRNNKISMNSAGISGGGIYYFASSTTPIAIQNNEISKNSALIGGGICISSSGWPGPKIINNTIVENVCEYGYRGGGLFCERNSLPIVLNTILWANKGGEIYLNENAEITVTYSNVQGDWEGEGNISSPPLFVDAYYGDYHLQSESPCIDAGTPDEAPPDDIEGNIRDEFPDMGAYEYIGIRPFPLGDVSGDWSVSAYDAALILQYVVGLIDSFPAESPVGQVAQKFIQGEITIEELNRTLSKLGYPSVFGTQLLQNYPNPFNPETWIPFKLAQDTLITISIYDAKGQKVKTITLGNRNAGIYTTKAKAAYWDGRSSLGQKVSSGVYYYTLQAGEFRATRKLVIVR